ncbi:hypothetical protein ACVIJ6_000913 [Bradyrhizobium sp. USDA 4369]
MTAMARVLSRALSGSPVGVKDEALRHLVLIFAATLLVVAMALTYGIDLSPGLF